MSVSSGAQSPWRIRDAGVSDLTAILSLYDEAVAWLVARGLSEQWGTTPVSSRTHLVEEIRGYLGDRYFSAVAVSSRHEPECVESIEDSPESILGFLALELLPDDYSPGLTLAYVHSLVSSRKRGAEGVGADLLWWAQSQARQNGAYALRLSCWAGNPKLVAYYESRGFVCQRMPDASSYAAEFEMRLLPADIDPPAI